MTTSYLNSGTTLKSWLLTKDHKRIAILYFFSIVFFFTVGGCAAGLMRLELIFPHGHFFTNDGYNRLFSLHGIVMVWFFLIPAIPTTLGNFLLPLMLGAKDLVYPRLNLISWYLFVISGSVALYALIRGGVDTGWTFYTPFSSTYSNSFVSITAIAVFINGFSSIFTGINFIATTHLSRRPGQSWFDLPLFIWSIYSTSLIFVLATPVLALTTLALIAERSFHVGIFDPNYGGDPLLFQNAFWFYSHPAVYIMLLPAMGVVSESIACFARRKIYGYKVAAFATVAIALYGFVVWGHHMFVAGTSDVAVLAFSFLSMLVAIPSAVKVFNWTATLFRASISLEAPMLYALSFIALFMIGGLSGIFLATLSVDVHVHDTYFVIAHFHYIMVGGSVTAFLGGLHFWWPKITGRTYNERHAQIAAVVLFLGFNCTFFPQFLMGYMGQPRRYHLYDPRFQIFHVASSLGSLLLALGYLLPVLYLGRTLLQPRNAPDNPWNARGLEWMTTSPPPEHNFETPPPSVPVYDYPVSRPGEARPGVAAPAKTARQPSTVAPT